MDIILLPVVKRTQSPEKALQILKESRRSVAVLVGSPPQGLITSFGVRKAKNQHQASLESVEVEPLTVLFDGDFSTEGYAALNLPQQAFAVVREHLLQTYPGMAHRRLYVPSEQLPPFEQLLPGGAVHGFLGYDRGAAVVMTRWESVAQKGAEPTPDCCCENPATPHEYPACQKKTGEPCEFCGYSMEC